MEKPPTDEEPVPAEYRLIAVMGRLAVLEEIAERHREQLVARCATECASESLSPPAEPLRRAG